MGLLDLFKKKKQKTLAEILCDAMNSKGCSATVQEGVVEEKDGLRIFAEVFNITDHGHAACAELHFVVKNESKGIEFFESLAGIGPKPNDAVLNAVHNFMYLVDFIHPVLAGRKNADFTLMTAIAGENTHFNCFFSQMMLQGDPSTHDLNLEKNFNLIKQEIEKVVDTKKPYFLKVYTSKMPDGSISAQCLINGEQFLAADQHIIAYTKGVKVKEFWGEKQFILLLPIC